MLKVLERIRLFGLIEFTAGSQPKKTKLGLTQMEYKSNGKLEWTPERIYAFEKCQL